MKISIFTPSHNPQFLDDAYQSILSQTYNDWEWVVLLNGEAEWENPDDHRVRVECVKSDIKGVGALKSKAVELCNGEIYLELDHDDILISNALERVVEAFEANPEVGFVYSNFAQINEDKTPNFSTFDLGYGWQYKEVNISGETYLECIAMPDFPAAVSYIWFAPNHVRAFRASVYKALRGYDSNLEVLDDLDLITQFYQNSKFYGIDECLYLQRVHPNNTQAQPELNERIQIETQQLYEQNIQPNALAWAKRNGLRCLDLGGAFNSPEGYESVDLLPNADLVGDVFEVLDSLEENSVGVIRAVDFLEHIPDKIRLFNSMYRVLAHGGMLLSLTPSSDGRAAFQDPTHVSFYNENSFWYYTKQQFAQYVPEIKCRFQSSMIKTLYFNEWYAQNKMPYVCANLIAIKDGPRIPGYLEI
jgi:glycosyltransferase involved in cell wall biosynthesis